MKIIEPNNTPIDPASRAAADRLTATPEAPNGPTPPMQESPQPSFFEHSPINTRPYKQDQPESLKSFIFKYFKSYFIGMLLMALFGLMVGVIFGSWLFESEAVKFAGFEDTFRIVSFVVPLTIILWFIGAGINNKVIALYPIVAFAIGSGYGVPSGVSFYLPAPLNDVVIQVMIAYIMAHVLVWPFSQLFKYYKLPNGPQRKFLLGGWFACYFIFAPLIGCLLLIGTQQIAASAVRQMATIHIAKESDFSANFTNQAKATDSPEMVLHYNPTTAPESGSFATSADIQNNVLKKVWLKNSPDFCTTGTARQTSSGVTYRETVEEKYSSTDKVESNLHKYYTYCFTIDYTTYTITQSDRLGPMTMKHYPIDKIIDGFKTGPTVNVLCARGIDKNDYRTTNTSLCTEKERQDWEAMLSTNDATYRSSESVPGGVEGLYIADDTYKQVGWLEIPELSIKLPVSEEVKNSSYKIEAGYYILTLRDIPNPSCSRSDPTPTEQYELGSIKPKSSEQVASNAGNSRNDDPIINGVVYSYSSVHCKFNVSAANLTEEQLNTYDDIFKWMIANGKPLS